jgi:polysaccharide pyruvyl transferase WcaK-like protein
LKKLHYYISQLQAEFIYLPKTLRFIFTKKKKAIYIGCTGQGNLGDEAVYLAIKNLLKDKLFLYPISYAKPSSGHRLRKLFFKQVDVIVFGGGTIIKKQKSESYLKLLTAYHEQFPNADLIVYGPGVGDPVLAEQVGFPTDVENWKIILNKCSFIGIRGIVSHDILKKDWHINPEVKVLHDPAIFFKRKAIAPKAKQKRIGLNFCNIIGRIYGLNQETLELFASGLVRKLIADGWDVFLYPTARTDIAYMKAVFGEEIISKVTLYNNYTNLEDSLAFMEGLDVFVGQRLHSIIFAAIAYTPFHAIEYESKTTDFLKSFGLKNASTRTDQLDVESTFKKINILYADLDTKQKELFVLTAEAYNTQMLVTQNLLKQL